MFFEIETRALISVHNIYIIVESIEVNVTEPINSWDQKPYICLFRKQHDKTAKFKREFQ